MAGNSCEDRTVASTGKQEVHAGDKKRRQETGSVDLSQQRSTVPGAGCASSVVHGYE